ncbi:hypothetical protein [Streptomyces mesophilus]|uniref:hypothetical protein n=1 Tax=Streptomyces mesophilus TaxID=1775132 RepID=UPI0033213B6D
MMFTYAEVRPDPREPLTRGLNPFALPASDDDSTLAGRLKRLYSERLRAYEKELELRSRMDSSYGRAGMSRYPRLRLLTGHPETYELVFDRELFRQFFDLYTLHGWGAIESAAELLLAKMRTNDPVWQEAGALFDFTRKALHLLVREALIDIERLAAEHLTLQLSQVSVELTTAWKRFDFHQVKVLVSMGRAGAAEVDKWALRDRKFAAALFASMKEAYGARKACDQLAAGQDETDGVASSMGALYRRMRAVIQLNAPLALLALEGMTEKTTQQDLEHDLGTLLKELFDRADRLGLGIDAAKGLVPWLLPSGRAYGPDILPVSVADVENTVLDRRRPEALCVERALDRVDDTPEGARWFPLVCDSVLDTLVESGTLRRDSFAYVVRHHYMAELGPQLAERYASSEGWKKFWSGFSQAAAGLSLILLATPAAEISPLVRGIAVAGDLILLAYTIHSTVTQLALLNETLSTTLMAPDALALPALARLGELRAYRRDFLDNIEESLLLAVLQLGVGRWAEVKPLLLAYGYYGDLRTLLGV